MQPLAAADRIRSEFPTNLSRSISVNMFDQDGREILIRANASSPIEMIIPRDPDLRSLSMTAQNVTSLNGTIQNLLFNLHFVKLAFDYSVSLHFQMRPLNSSLAYLLIYAFDRSPRLNRSVDDIDGWTLFCPSSECNSIDEEASEYISLSSCRYDQRLSSLSRSLSDNWPAVSYLRFAWIDGQRNTRPLLQSVDEPGSAHPISTVPFHIRLSASSLHIRMLLSGCQPTVAIGWFAGKISIDKLQNVTLSDSVRWGLWRISIVRNASPHIWRRLPVVSSRCLRPSIGTMSFPMLISCGTKPSIWRWLLLWSFMFYWSFMRVTKIRKISTK